MVGATSILENIQDKFENLDIYIYSIEVEEIKDVNQEMFPFNTPFTGIWHNTNTHFYLPNRKEIVGKIYLLLKSQADKSTQGLWIASKLRVSAQDDLFANMVCKLIQYLFEIISKYVTDNNVRDDAGNHFVIPSFLYSKSQFEGAFPN